MLSAFLLTSNYDSPTMSIDGYIIISFVYEMM